MAKLAVYNWNKEQVGEVTLSDEVFAAPLRKDLLNSVVKWQLAKRRQGTHKVKSRGEVSGGGKKPFKQKGTGEARQGSSRSPLNPGGGVAHGPSPRSYEHSLPRKVRKAALRTALSHLVREGRFYVVEDMNSKEGKTKELAARLKKFGSAKAVLIDTERNDSFLRASRNLSRFHYLSVKGLNVYDILKFDTAIVTKQSLEKIVERCVVE